MTRSQEPPPTVTEQEARMQREIPDSMLEVLGAMGRGELLVENLGATEDEITCGAMRVTRRTLKGLLSRGLLKHDGGYPIRKYSKR